MAQMRAQLRAKELAEVKSIPSISARSQLLARSMDRQPAWSMKSIQEFSQSKARKIEVAEQIKHDREIESFQGTPLINSHSRSLRRGIDDLYNWSSQVRKRKDQALMKKARKEREYLQKLGEKRLMAQGSQNYIDNRNQPIEERLLLQGRLKTQKLDQKRKAEDLALRKQREPKRRKYNAYTSLSPKTQQRVSFQIKESSSQISISTKGSKLFVKPLDLNLTQERSRADRRVHDQGTSIPTFQISTIETEPSVKNIKQVRSAASTITFSPKSVDESQKPHCYQPLFDRIKRKQKEYLFQKHQQELLDSQRPEKKANTKQLLNQFLQLKYRGEKKKKIQKINQTQPPSAYQIVRSDMTQSWEKKEYQVDSQLRASSPLSEIPRQCDSPLSLKGGYERVQSIKSQNGQRIQKMLIDKILEADIVTKSGRREHVDRGASIEAKKKSPEKREISPFVERSLKWKEERDLKVQRARHLQQAAILKLCTFEPTISAKSRRTVKKLEQDDSKPFSQFFSIDTTQAAEDTNRKILEVVSEKTEKATTDVIRSGRQSTSQFPRVGSTELCGPEPASSVSCSQSIPEQFEQSFQVNDRRESYRPSLYQ